MKAATHLVTGAGSGIGAAVARLLDARGDHLLLVARNEARAAVLAEAFPRAEVLVADLADADGLAAALVDRLPDRLDSVVHSAGVVELGPVAEQDVSTWRHTLEVNLVAPAELTRLALPALRAARGHVVLVNSGAGHVAAPDWASYAASKHGLRALADSLRAEEQEHGVRVISVHPGRTATPMQQKVHAQEGKEYDPSAWTSPEAVATTVLHALDLPRDAALTEVRIRPGG
ncbi:MAG: SDR family oxidoreductase [Nocardioides sp.]|nr:SDR family oxidoreductase [Nocardioides sp.]